MKFIFWFADEHQTIIQIDRINLRGMTRSAQIIESIAILQVCKSLQYLKKDVRGEVDFLCK